MSLLFLLSPAKRMELNPVTSQIEPTEPEFLKSANEIVQVLSQYPVEILAEILDVSQDLAELNHQRFQSWENDHALARHKAALLAYKGDVYQQIEVDSYSRSEAEFAQKNIRIFSGLYGILRPYDGIQAYRLEMDTAAKVIENQKLPDYWRDKVTQSLQETIKRNNAKFVINLASTAYSQVVDWSKLPVSFMDVYFLQKREGQLKNIGILAKKARGQMINWAIKNQVKNLEKLLLYRHEGYQLHFQNDQKIEFVREG